MAKRQFMFTFTEEAIAEPIIYNVAQQFNLMANIRRADLAEDRGWIIVELEGEDSSIEAGIAWAISRGVRVESADEERS